jgi:hypothetical protein
MERAMNPWIRLSVAAVLVLATSDTGRAEMPVTSCLDLVMTVHDVEPDLSQDASDYSWPDRWPDMSGWDEEPPGI